MPKGTYDYQPLLANENPSDSNPLDENHKYLTPTGDTVFVEQGEYNETIGQYQREYHADVYELPDGTRVAKLM